MKKLFSAFMIISTLGSIAWALNFNGNQSLNGLQTTKIFTAPTNAYYFVNGQLMLPQPSSNGSTGYSQVEAIVSKNGTTVVYDSLSGASGFQINQISLVTGDSVSVQLKSGAAIDQGINAVRGEVYYGNTF